MRSTSPPSPTPLRFQSTARHASSSNPSSGDKTFNIA
eukprot:CAMPEP_0174958446 /NCGR_PEP_ID=MMETSP0004_2-20121128/2626_1 /TAXON_ID=420556 /ORGANISM="Ochromonas sp., Strain CCMP1393" /LENGTH=36 /DNA_ID= /DNA_START= /DNA_END= /DNA_ORIENTATION=